MKKIMILGGGENQLPLIKAAKAENYFVVLCDGASNPVGKKYVDSFFQINTIDKDSVIEIAQRERIDGVISNSEPAMATVAAVVDTLGLIGTCEDTVHTLQSKCAFRCFQKNIGVFCPNSIEAEDISEIQTEILKLHFPIIIKPSECSGSRGITILKEYNDEVVNKAFTECQHFSRNKYVTVEEYIPFGSMLAVGGDIFVHRGKIIWDGLASCIRFPNRKEVPGGKIWPIVENSERLSTLKEELQEILNKVGANYGAFNIEGFFYDEVFFVIEINARQGGNSIPQLVQEYSGIDMYRLLVTTCVGDDYYFYEVINNKRDYNFLTNYIVFSEQKGIYDHIEIHDSLNEYVSGVVENVTSGDVVKKGIDAADAVAMVRMKFPNREAQLDNIMNLPECINAILV